MLAADLPYSLSTISCTAIASPQGAFTLGLVVVVLVVVLGSHTSPLLHIHVHRSKSVWCQMMHKRQKFLYTHSTLSDFTKISIPLWKIAWAHSVNIQNDSSNHRSNLSHNLIQSLKEFNSRGILTSWWSLQDHITLATFHHLISILTYLWTQPIVWMNEWMEGSKSRWSRNEDAVMISRRKKLCDVPVICAASAKAELRDLDHFDERLESLLVTTPAPSTSKKHKWSHSNPN